MAKTYTIILDPVKSIRSEEGRAIISEEGALIIWAAYTKLYGASSQTMERREERGGVCHLSEINYWKGLGALDNNFNWEDYKVEKKK